MVGKASESCKQIWTYTNVFLTIQILNLHKKISGIILYHQTEKMEWLHHQDLCELAIAPKHKSTKYS